jgi:hypothetical protein
MYSIEIYKCLILFHNINTFKNISVILVFNSLKLSISYKLNTV